jgi:hypothetical protein
MALTGVTGRVLGAASIAELMARVIEVFVAGPVSLPSMKIGTEGRDEGIYKAASPRLLRLISLPTWAAVKLKKIAVDEGNVK